MNISNSVLQMRNECTVIYPEHSKAVTFLWCWIRYTLSRIKGPDVFIKSTHFKVIAQPYISFSVYSESDADSPGIGRDGGNIVPGIQYRIICVKFIVYQSIIIVSPADVAPII